MDRGTEKRIRKTDKKKSVWLSILVLIMLLLVAASVHASEMKGNGKTAQAMEKEIKP